MVRIYAGNPSRIDPEILAAVKTLPDDFVAFAEFDIDRNIDWLIIHVNRTEPASLVVTELKRTTRRLRGDVNGFWEESTDGIQWTPMLSSGREMNPYQQATAAANALKEWLWVHQRFFLDDQEERPQDAFKVWPDLLILSPEGVAPILPMRPSSRFGFWFFSIEQWLSHLRGWRALPEGVVLSDASVRRIVEQLRLSPIWPDAAAAAETVEEPRPEERPTERPIERLDLEALAARLRQLEQRVAQLEAESRGRREAPPPLPTLARQPAIAKPLTEQERSALVSAVTAARLAGKSRAVPTIIGYMDRLLGYPLKDTAYNGRGTATALMEQARAEGVIVLGPRSGPNATIYLPGEDVPAA